MTTAIKAIETKYKGYRFRSRLEARWAVFFDALDLKWEYENEGYDLDEAGWYLPDFWLPDMGIWVEIKPATASDKESQKAYRLSAMSKKGVLIIQGQPGIDPLFPEYGIYSYSANYMLYAGECFDTYDLPCCFVSSSYVWSADRFESLRRMLISERAYFSDDEWHGKTILATDENGRRERLIYLDKLYFLRKHQRSHQNYIHGRTLEVCLKYDNRRGKIELVQDYNKRIDNIGQVDTRIRDAHSRARSARFEYGETPI